MTGRGQGLLRSSLVYSGGLLLVRALSLLLLPLYTRALTAADWGLLAVCSTTVLVFQKVATPSVDSALRLLAPKLAEDDQRRLRALSSLWAATTPLVLALALEALGPSLCERWMPAVPWRPYMRLAVWTGYLSIAAAMPANLLVGRENASGYVGFQALSALAVAGGQIYFVVLRGEGALGSLRGHLLAQAILALAAHAMVLKESRFDEGGGLLREALRISVPLMPYAVFMWVMDVSDRWILGRYCPLEELGRYGLAYTLGSAGVMIGTAVDFAFMPAYLRRSRDPEFRRALPRVLRANAAAQGWIWVALCAAAPELFRALAPPDYHGGWPLVRWIAPAFWFSSVLCRVAIAVIADCRRTELLALATLAPGLLNVGLNLWLVPDLGAWAAAVSTLASYGLMAWLCVSFAESLDPLPWPWASLARTGLAALALGTAGQYLLTRGSLAASLGLKAAWLAGSAWVLARAAGLPMGEMAALTRRRDGGGA